MDRVIEVTTFGCKVNTYDSGLLEQRFHQAGFKIPNEISSSEKNLSSEENFSLEGRTIHILNSCAVTAEATAQALRQARRLKRQNPQSVVVVTGCSAQVDTERFANVSEVDLIVANSHKGELPRLLQDWLQGKIKDRVFKSNIFKKDDLEVGGGTNADHTRSFLKIQDGCDSFCTFCVIPFARGKSRSIEPELLVQKINQMHESGVNEVVLTGVHIGDYRSPTGQGLSDLVETILIQTKMPRLRLSSLEPIELSPHLFSLYADPRMCPHFHMSIQSASSTVLAKMKRQYTAEQVSEALWQIEKYVPGAYVGMDVIAGFAEESEEEFHETFQRLSDSPWTRLHVFPYSPRPNTYAARALKEISSSIVHSRALKLRTLSHERISEHAIGQIGKIKKVLWLKDSSEVAPHGLAQDYWPVVSAESAVKIKPGSETTMRITGCDREPHPSGSLRLYGLPIAKEAVVY